MKFDAGKFRERAKEDFEKAWHEGPEVLTPPADSGKYPRLRFGQARPHPVFETINRLREVYLSLGFEECCNPLIVDEQEVYRQFGPEAMAVLDRVFYLGGLPRPNVGIGKERIDAIGGILGKEIGPDIEERLRETLHAYKKGEVEGDDLVHAISEVLAADDATVVKVMDRVFPEFRELSPESTRRTLRSHMTSGWFLTLSANWERRPHPIRLFSVDRCFRREQEEGPTRLMTYHSASCVVAGEDVTNEEGKAVAEALLSAFGFTKFTFRPDEKRSKYYMPGTQTEVYASHPARGDVEVATFGVYSPSALAEYGIEVPVMNLGLGVERLAMILTGSEDVRALSYPQFYPRDSTDREMAGAISLKEEPATVTGRLIARAIRETGMANPTAPGPCSFTAWEGDTPRAQAEGLRGGARGECQTPRPRLRERGLCPPWEYPGDSREREVGADPEGGGLHGDHLPGRGGSPCRGPDRRGCPVREGCHGPGEDVQVPERREPEGCRVRHALHHRQEEEDRRQGTGLPHRAVSH